MHDERSYLPLHLRHPPHLTTLWRMPSFVRECENVLERLRGGSSYYNYDEQPPQSPPSSSTYRRTGEDRYGRASRDEYDNFDTTSPQSSYREPWEETDRYYGSDEDGFNYDFDD